jgi:SAM-dependent methyltransferase
MAVTNRSREITACSYEDAEHSVAVAYNQAGLNYGAYADGESAELFVFQGQHAYGDQRIWELLDEKMRALRSSGAQSIRILDLGCGPGTWLRRIATRAWSLGFTSIIARGIDIAGAQVRQGRTQSCKLGELGGVNLTFEEGDICKQFPEADASIDLCLCLYGVLNHIPPDRLSSVLAEVARVTCGHFVMTVRAVGSMPTICVDALEEARWFWRDIRTNRLEVELQSGRQVSLDYHLFETAELRAFATPHFQLDDLQGIDLFHGRFAGDPRWNPPGSMERVPFIQELDRLERLYCRDPEFIDHATHLLLIAAPRKDNGIAADAMLVCANSASRVHRGGQQVHIIPTASSEDSHENDKTHENER